MAVPTGDTDCGCALYPWFEELGPQWIHPQDIDAFRQLFPYRRVFTVLDQQDGFTRIAHGDQVFRVKPSLLESVSTPRFTVGQVVRIPGKDGEAVIEGIYWHFKDRKPYFMVRYKGKLKSKRYWAEDLVGT